jgi:hypothetical protein
MHVFEQFCRREKVKLVICSKKCTAQAQRKISCIVRAKNQEYMLKRYPAGDASAKTNQARTAYFDHLCEQ